MQWNLRKQRSRGRFFGVFLCFTVIRAVLYMCFDDVYVFFCCDLGCCYFCLTVFLASFAVVDFVVSFAVSFALPCLEPQGFPPLPLGLCFLLSKLGVSCSTSALLLSCKLLCCGSCTKSISLPRHALWLLSSYPGTLVMWPVWRSCSVSWLCSCVINTLLSRSCDLMCDTERWRANLEQRRC